MHEYGVPLDEFSDAIIEGIAAGKEEIGYGTSAKALRMSRDEIDKTVAQINQQLSIPND